MDNPTPRDASRMGSNRTSYLALAAGLLLVLGLYMFVSHREVKSVAAPPPAISKTQ